LYLDRQIVVAAFDSERLGTVAQLAADMHFVAVPGGDGDLARDVADVDVRCGRRGMTEVDWCIGKCLPSPGQAQEQRQVVGVFHSYYVLVALAGLFL
jgi:hypothetical protein